MRIVFAIPGVIVSMVSLVIMMVAMIPLLGWINWFNIPLAVVGLLLSMLGGSRTGTTICLVAILAGIIRLGVGCGIL